MIPSECNKIKDLAFKLRLIVAEMQGQVQSLKKLNRGTELIEGRVKEINQIIIGLKNMVSIAETKSQRRFQKRLNSPYL